LETKKAVHQGKLQSTPGWYALEPSQESQDDGQKQHKNCQQQRRQDTLDNTDRCGAQTIQPRKPGVRGCERVDVRERADKRDGERPCNHKPDRAPKRDEPAQALLVRIQAEIAPDHVGRCNLGVLLRHAIRLVVREALRGEVRGNLLIEEHERRVKRRVRVVLRVVRGLHVRAVVLARMAKPHVRARDLLARPVDAVDLLADERKSEREPAEPGGHNPVRRSLGTRDKHLREVDTRMRAVRPERVRVLRDTGGRRFASLDIFLGLLRMPFDRGLDQRCLGVFKHFASIQLVLVEDRHVFEVPIEPHFCHTAGEIRVKFGKGVFGKVLLGYAGD
jgi:hypothetical protein